MALVTNPYGGRILDTSSPPKELSQETLSTIGKWGALEVGVASPTPWGVYTWTPIRLNPLWEILFLYGKLPWEALFIILKNSLGKGVAM
jgi:hypothetical protein